MNQDEIQNTPVSLEISLKEVNELLSILSKGKYSRVAPLIAKIQTQSIGQINNLTSSLKDQTKS